MSDALVQFAVLQAFSLLPTERQFDLERMVDAIDGARRIAEQSKEAGLALLGNREREGMVIALRSHPAPKERWPRWSGVSIYRPNRLDDLMRASYARFAFHRRVHWAALLGAANLIEDHPRALWRLVSSLLATGSGATRRDVLRRLTGADSVVWGLRDQFQVMTPAPTLTLSLERRGMQLPAAGAPPLAREHYLLRLEAVNRGAVVTEQESRVQPKLMDRALDELNTLLQEPAMTVGSLKKLQSIGGLLGEDIFQSLGRTLEDERLAIVADDTGITPHLQLQIPGELMKYPWELLHQDGKWLGERYAMGRQVFMQTGLARRVPARRQGRIRPLIIGDPVLEAPMSQRWRQLPGARDEAEQVAAFFEASSIEAGSLIDFDRRRDVKIHEPVTCADMRALLRDGSYDIVHFAGHGIFESRDPETSAWILSDGELWSLEIRNTLAAHRAPPWLVYANACEAGMDAGGPPRSYQGNVFGLATAFINQGVAAYIGPLWPIEDLMAQHIALNFYHHLLRDRLTLGESLRRSKMSARQTAYPENTDRADEDKSFAALGLGEPCALWRSDRGAVPGPGRRLDGCLVVSDDAARSDRSAVCERRSGTVGERPPFMSPIAWRNNGSPARASYRSIRSRTERPSRLVRRSPRSSSSKTRACVAGECQAHASLEAPEHVSMTGCQGRRSRHCWQTIGSAGSCQATVGSPA